MPKTNILHLIKSLGRGGAEMLLPETLKLHSQEHFHFHCIYFLPWKDQLVGDIEKAGGEVVCIPAKNNVAILLAAGKIARYVKEHKIDLVHCHLPWAGFVGRLVHKMTGVPMVYSEHNKQERYHRITFWLNKLSFNFQSSAIAVSADVQESIIKHIRPSIPVRVLLNGVNTQTFVRDEALGSAQKAALGIPAHAVIIGTVAVFRFQKRLEEWLEVFKRVSDQNDQVYAVIVGDGILKENIQHKRKELGLEGKVFMPGLQTETLAFFSMMDIYLMTSVFEGLPIALLEAMSVGCAVATTNAGGIKEMITDGREGVLVDVADWEQLVPPLQRLVVDAEERSRLGKAARARVEAAFSLQRMVVELEETYTNLLQP